MQERKRNEKMRSFPDLSQDVSEILVANGRAFEPFVKTFSYTGENISKISLGTLVGVFVIDEKSEDSAYIVNFLSSVAKKEYFGNPRRGAIESFEASLHKINLALAELVKHGNIAWLGKFHGALGVFEKNNFHFSVTGESKILLLRNENLTDIAEGLASEESHIHPIKTFVEVSSGKLLPDDKIILTTPELLRLFNEEDIRKNALRMDNERFRQFLKTALINELDMAATVVADIEEKKLTPVKQTKEETGEETVETVLKNVFSNTTFSQKKQSTPEEQAAQEQPDKTGGEYVDTKTGHIYVQGDTPGKPSTHPVLEKAGFIAQDIGASLLSALASQKKWLRKTRKQAVLESISLAQDAQAMTRKTARGVRKLIQKTAEKWRKASQAREEKKKAENVRLEQIRTETEQSEKKEVTHVTDIPQPSQAPKTPPIEEVESESAGEESALPSFIREKLAGMYKKERGAAPAVFPPQETSPSRSDLLDRTRSLLSETMRKTRSTLTSLSSALTVAKSATARTATALRDITPRRRKQTLTTLGIIAVFGLVAYGVSTYLKEKPEDPITAVENAPENELVKESAPTLSRPQTEISTITTSTDEIIRTVTLDDTLYIVTAKNITRVSDNQSFPLPSGGNAAFATAMDDLPLIFVYTDNKELFAWSPITRNFATNSLSLPATASVKDIGTYLTYLYVLDDKTDQVYRFPRAEGGFGQPQNWLRETANFSANAKMAVNETIFISPDMNRVTAFFRGRTVKDVEMPSDNKLSVTSLYTHPGLANVYALDKENRRVVVWNQEGKLIGEYYSDKFAEAKTISADEKKKEIFVSASRSIFSFTMK